jgi:hypothetical protein
MWRLSAVAGCRADRSFNDNRWSVGKFKKQGFESPASAAPMEPRKRGSGAQTESASRGEIGKDRERGSSRRRQRDGQSKPPIESKRPRSRRPLSIGMKAQHRHETWPIVPRSKLLVAIVLHVALATASSVRTNELGRVEEKQVQLPKKNILRTENKWRTLFPIAGRFR